MAGNESGDINRGQTSEALEVTVGFYLYTKNTRELLKGFQQRQDWIGDGMMPDTVRKGYSGIMMQNELEKSEKESRRGFWSGFFHLKDAC